MVGFIIWLVWVWVLWVFFWISDSFPVLFTFRLFTDSFLVCHFQLVLTSLILMCSSDSILIWQWEATSLKLFKKWNKFKIISSKTKTVHIPSSALVSGTTYSRKKKYKFRYHKVFYSTRLSGTCFSTCKVLH